MLLNHYFDQSNSEIMFNRLRDSSDEKKKSMVELINQKLTKLKYIVFGMDDLKFAAYLNCVF